jgi:DNA-binding transcriptional LysR family regulator
MRKYLGIAVHFCNSAWVPGGWSDYRYFLAVAKAGSLSAAARRIRVDQSTVGRRLAALEAQVGARLFDHTPEGYVLTAAGQGVLADVEELESGFLAVERRLAGGDGRIEGVVRLATTESFASAFLIDHFGRLRSRHPGLSIELLTGNRPVDLARREADLAVRLGAAPKQPNLIVRQIGAVGFALYAAPSYLARRGRPSLRGGLRGHEIVCYGSDLAAAPIARWMVEHAHEAELALRADSLASVHRAVAAGLGLGVLPCLLGQGLERISPAVLGRSPIWTVVHEDLVRNARVRAVLLFLSELTRQERRALAGA